MRRDSFILTLKLNGNSQAYFDAIREVNYPKHINKVKAHCTLFHNLPADFSSLAELKAVCARQLEIPFLVNEICKNSNGVSFILCSDDLQKFHHLIQQNFIQQLTLKDKRSLNAHITVQNKVTAFKADTLYKSLNSGFVPFNGYATGVSLWRYIKGPWEHIEDYPFF